MNGAYKTTLLVAGGRSGRNLSKKRVWKVLDHLARDLPTPLLVVHGRAIWTDTWAGEWGYERGHKVQPVPIDDEIDGFKEDAPFNRNARMLADFPPDLCVGFPGGGGTLDMMTRAQNAGVAVADVALANDDTFEVKWWPLKFR